MKKFATELHGKTVMTQEGQILGMIDNFMADMRTGKFDCLLVTPAEGVDTRLLKVDALGRIILPFVRIQATGDVVVVDMESLYGPSR